jgi:amino acid transporter/nucleotide-binding universal stress UspA family protein
MSMMDATLIGVGAMIGAGIFVLIGIAAGVAGPALLLSFVLNGLIALFTAMSYAELGSCYHDAGGGYLWVKEGLAKWNGFLSGWMSWFAHAVACSLYALGFGAYFEHVLREFAITLPQWGFLSPQKLLAVGTAIVFAYVNYRGASEAGKIGNLVTVSKIIILLIFSAFGLELIIKSADPLAAFREFMPKGVGGVFKAMGLTFIAFQGFEVIAQSSEEIKDPKKNIPRAVFLSLLIVVPIYLVVTVVALGSVEPPPGMTSWQYLAEHKEVALVEVARSLFRGGGVLILIGGLISTISALNATIYSSSRVAFAMGRDRNFPAFFSRVHRKRRTPHWSILVSTLLIVFMAISLPIEDVASAADIMFLLVFLQVNLAMIKLRKARPDLDRGYRAPLFPVLSIIGIVLLLVLALYMFNYSVKAWIVTLAWIGAGLLVYRFYASSREIEHERKLKTLDRLTKKQYSILLHLEGEEAEEGLIEVAIAIAKAHGGSLLFLQVVEVSEGRKLRIEDGSAEARGAFLDSALAKAESGGVPAKALVKVSHRITQGILDTAIEESCNLILACRERRAGFLKRLYYTVFDRAMRNATSEIGLLHGSVGPAGIRKVLVVYRGDLHSRLAAEMAPNIIGHLGAVGRYLIPVPAELTKAERGRSIEELRASLREQGIEAEAKIFAFDDPVGGIARAAAKVDLVILGSEGGRGVELPISPSPEMEIVDQVRCPVLWFREFEEKESILRSLFGTSRKTAKESLNGH